MDRTTRLRTAAPDPLRFIDGARRCPRVMHKASDSNGLANLFAALPAQLPEEQFVELLKRPGFTIERIVSTGQASPPGFWYDQPKGERVLLLSGEARLRFEDEPQARTLKPGDFVDIPPRRRHRVDWTQPDQPTVWLAVHYA